MLGDTEAEVGEVTNVTPSPDEVSLTPSLLD